MPTRKFPGRHDSLKELGDYISEQAAAAGFDEKDSYAVQLAVDEAAANIIEHAYGGEDIGDFECTCHVSAGQIEIILKDSGSSFSPMEVPELLVGVPLEDFGPRGAGLRLMTKLMDDVQFEFSPGANKLVMVKRKDRGND